MKKLVCLMLALLMFPLTALAECLPQYPYEACGKEITFTYDSESLKYTVEKFIVGEPRTVCYVSKVWMADPGRQIKKATSTWRYNLAKPEDMARAVPGAALVINGSGYVTKRFPEIPDSYPGTSEDYYYTPLGSITVTDGEVFRDLKGVPFYGLTLEDDGLHMYVGEDNDEVLSHMPQQTWSFYEGCPLVQDHVSILDRDWTFAKARAIRTIIAKMDNNNYLLFTVTSIHGLTLIEATDWLMETFDPIWVYDLDGGPSSALLCRKPTSKSFYTVYGGSSPDVDIMAFVELPLE